MLFVVSFLYAWFIRWITEIAVTDRRIIYKRGFITRHTDEMNMDKVASVDVDQSILGRMLDYGTVHVHRHRRRAIADPSAIAASRAASSICIGSPRRWRCATRSPRNSELSEISAPAGSARRAGSSA